VKISDRIDARFSVVSPQIGDVDCPAGEYLCRIIEIELALPQGRSRFAGSQVIAILD
jgi:hypothetical protein